MNFDRSPRNRLLFTCDKLLSVIHVRNVSYEEMYVSTRSSITARVSLAVSFGRGPLDFGAIWLTWPSHVIPHVDAKGLA